MSIASMTSQGVLLSITNFGDLAVLLPIVFVMFIWLLSKPRKIGALWWAVSASICMGGTALLKLIFFVCPPANDMQSPSGHSSLSTLVYGALVILIAVNLRGWKRWAIITGGTALVLAIGMSRVLLSSHTLPETLFGLAIGAVALGVFAHGYLTRSPTVASLRPLLVCVVLLIALLHGQHLHAEELLRAIGLYLKADGVTCG